MSELMEVYEPGDRFATVNREGRVLVWRVDEDGLARVQPEARSWANPVAVRTESPRTWADVDRSAGDE
jgi:hypothetical protein